MAAQEIASLLDRRLILDDAGVERHLDTCRYRWSWLTRLLLSRVVSRKSNSTYDVKSIEPRFLIPSNVAEGWKRKRRRGAYHNYVSIAMESHAELETQLEVCFRNGFLERAKCADAWTLLIRGGPLLERLHDSLD